jgi:signal-transduction protein with cAMP-binding, CBS, and nucleotidyltransferase domain
VIVRDSKGKLIGLVTEQDFVRKIIVKKLPFSTPIKKIMSKSVITITPEKDIFDGMVLMKNSGFKRIPVVENESVSPPKLLGMLTIKDILKIEPVLFDIAFEKYELREERRKPIFQGTKEDVCAICGHMTANIISRKGMRVCRICSKEI